MFKCGSCGTVSKPGEKPVRTVVEVRSVVHPRRWSIKTPDFVRDRPTDPSVPFDERDTEWVVDSGGYGTQISREKLLCQMCNRKSLAASAKATAVLGLVAKIQGEDRSSEEVHASRATRA